MTEAQEAKHKARIAERQLRYLDALEDYTRKFNVPIIGVFYSFPAWRRYLKAFDDLIRARLAYIQALNVEIDEMEKTIVERFDGRMLH